MVWPIVMVAVLILGIALLNRNERKFRFWGNLAIVGSVPYFIFTLYGGTEWGKLAIMAIYLLGCIGIIKFGSAVT